MALRGGDYSRVRSLEEAVEVCRRSLRDDGREEYAALVTEERVRSAIGTALEKHRHALEKKSLTYGPDYPWVRDEEVEQRIRHFEEVVKPVYLDIAAGGAWPRGASFGYYLFRQDDDLVRYDCFRLHLHIETPGTLFRGFAVAVISLYYGGVPPAGEDDE